MSFNREDCNVLRKNPHAKECADFLVCEVYPSIVCNLKNLGKLEYSFELGKNKFGEERYRIKISLNENNVLKIDMISYRVCADGKQEVILRDYTYHIDKDNECYYFDECTGNTIHSSQVEPIFQNIDWLDIEKNMFLTATHFYLFYCEKIISIAEELNKTYRDGFLNVVDRAKRIIVPVTRTVLIEKIRSNGN